MNNSFSKIVAVLGIATLMLSGCAREIGSSHYTSGSVGTVSETYEGVISNVRVVTVDAHDELEHNVLGGLLGAAAGGYAGSGIGKGRGQDAAIIGGAILGATAGAAAERQIKRQQGYEYTVRLNSGRMVTVVQGTDTVLSVGQRVRVYISGSGGSRSRVVAY